MANYLNNKINIHVIPLVVVLIHIITCITQTSVSSSNVTTGTVNICKTSACLKMADHLNSNIDYKVNPCEDFYSFACGNYKIRDPYEEVEARMIDLYSMEKPIDVIFGSKNLAKLRHFYRDCKSGANTHLKAIVRALGGFPLIGKASGFNLDARNATNNTFNWLDLVKNKFNIGLEHFFDVSSIAPGQVKPRGRMNDTSYYKYMIVPQNGSATFSLDEVKKLYRFEPYSRLDFEAQSISLLKFVKRMEAVFRKPGNDHQLMSLNELEWALPSVNWSRLMHIERGRENKDRISATRFGRFITLAKLVNQTDQNDVQNYLFVRLINDYLSRNCAWRIDEFMEIANRIEFYKHYVNDELIGSIEEIIATIKREFANKFELNKSIIIENLTSNKLKQLRHYLGVHDLLLANKFADSIYDEFTFDSNGYFNGTLPKVAPKWSKELRDELSPCNRKRISGCYYAETNSLTIYARLMLPYFVDPSRPSLFNYARLGFVVASHMNKAFALDTVERDLALELQAGPNRYKPVQWNEAIQSVALYRNSSKCVQERHDKLYPNVHLNFELKRTNIDDNKALFLAYRAYQSHQIRNKLAGVQLPDLNFTQNQLFWISMAQDFCMHPDSSQSIFKVRLNSSLSNYDEFSRDFNCSPKTPMNSQEKCAIW